MKVTKSLLVLIVAIIWILIVTGVTSCFSSIAVSASEALHSPPTATFAAADTTMSSLVAQTKHEATLKAALEAQ